MSSSSATYILTFLNLKERVESRLFDTAAALDTPMNLKERVERIFSGTLAFPPNLGISKRELKERRGPYKLRGTRANLKERVESLGLRGRNDWLTLEESQRES